MRGQAVVAGHCREQLTQSVALPGVEPVGDAVFVLTCDPGYLAQQRFPGCGEVKGMQAAIIGIAAPL